MEDLLELKPKNPRRVAAGKVNGRLAKNRKTIEGRAASSRNAGKHLLSAVEHQLLPHEDSAVYRAFHDSILHDLAPQDTYEFTLVSCIIQSLWQINRCEHRERVAMHLAYEEVYANPVNYPEDSSLTTAEILDWMATERCYKNSAYHLIARYKTQHERSYARTLKLLNDHRKQPKPVTPTPFLPDDFATRPLPTAPAPMPQAPPEPVPESAPEAGMENCETKVSALLEPLSPTPDPQTESTNYETKVSSPPDRSPA